MLPVRLFWIRIQLTVASRRLSPGQKQQQLAEVEAAHFEDSDDGENESFKLLGVVVVVVVCSLSPTSADGSFELEELKRKREIGRFVCQARANFVAKLGC